MENATTINSTTPHLFKHLDAISLQAPLKVKSSNPRSRVNLQLEHPLQLLYPIPRTPWNELLSLLCSPNYNKFPIPSYFAFPIRPCMSTFRFGSRPSSCCPFPTPCIWYTFPFRSRQDLPYSFAFLTPLQEFLNLKSDAGVPKVEASVEALRQILRQKWLLK